MTSATSNVSCLNGTLRFGSRQSGGKAHDHETVMLRVHRAPAGRSSNRDSQRLALIPGSREMSARPSIGIRSAAWESSPSDCTSGDVTRRENGSPFGTEQVRFQVERAVVSVSCDWKNGRTPGFLLAGHLEEGAGRSTRC
jgi:hypothetical protein